MDGARSADHGRDAAQRYPQDMPRRVPGQSRLHSGHIMDHGRMPTARGYGVTPSRVHPSDEARRGFQLSPLRDSECCAERITRRLDDGDDDQEGSSASGDAAVPDGLTAEEIVAFKKARRKEQCRVNQANYRKRKRAFEQQMDREIGALKEEIRELTAVRNQARRQASAKPRTATRPADPLQVVHDFYQHLIRAIETESSRHSGQPPEGVETIVGLQYERFDSLEGLFDTWQGYASSFETFSLELVSVRGTRIGESIIVSAQAELVSSLHSHEHAVRLGLRGSQVVHSSVVQRFVFDGSHQDLAVIVSEVDWIPALADSSASPVSQIRSAAELLRGSSQGNHATWSAKHDTA